MCRVFESTMRTTVCYDLYLLAMSMSWYQSCARCFVCSCFMSSCRSLNAALLTEAL